MKRVMPSTGVSNAHPDTILSLQLRLAVLYQLERKLKWQHRVLEACRAEVSSAAIARPPMFTEDAASRHPG
jgi:cytochrome oxidase assembly protein ShyY1